MSAPVLVRIRCKIDAPTAAAASATLATKMAALAPGVEYEVTQLAVTPAPPASGERLIGPPWRFDVEVTVVLSP